MGGSDLCHDAQSPIAVPVMRRGATSGETVWGKCCGAPAPGGRTAPSPCEVGGGGMGAEGTQRKLV